jgi:hypothetical protein
MEAKEYTVTLPPVNNYCILYLKCWSIFVGKIAVYPFVHLKGQLLQIALRNELQEGLANTFLFEPWLFKCSLGGVDFEKFLVANSNILR